jgi:hypothetical protein
MHFQKAGLFNRDPRHSSDMFFGKIVPSPDARLQRLAET